MKVLKCDICHAIRNVQTGSLLAEEWPTSSQRGWELRQADGGEHEFCGNCKKALDSAVRSALEMRRRERTTVLQHV
jgi:hypothetical protein